MPKIKSAAEILISEVNSALIRCQAHLKKDERCRVSYAGAFGVMEAVSVGYMERDFLRIVVVDDEGKESTIVAPVSQCSVMVEAFVPKNEGEKQRAERVVTGFSPPIPAT